MNALDVALLLAVPAAFVGGVLLGRVLLRGRR
jgi:hypothetical protein